jgi:hypothetical protein
MCVYLMWDQSIDVHERDLKVVRLCVKDIYDWLVITISVAKNEEKVKSDIV